MAEIRRKTIFHWNQLYSAFCIDFNTISIFIGSLIFTQLKMTVLYWCLWIHILITISIQIHKYKTVIFNRVKNQTANKYWNCIKLNTKRRIQLVSMEKCFAPYFSHKLHFFVKMKNIVQKLKSFHFQCAHWNSQTPLVNECRVVNVTPFIRWLFICWITLNILS